MKSSNESPEHLEERKERGRAELLAKGYAENEITWCPPQTGPVATWPPSGDPKSDARRAHADEKWMRGGWYVGFDAMLRIHYPALAKKWANR